MSVSSGELFRTSLKIGLLSFGGPAGQIALMHRIYVDEKNWLSEEDYLSALSFCMLLPGPEAMQLATYAGWRLKGVFGGLIAGLLFVLPGAFVILALALLYATFGATGWAEALFLGVKAAVVVNVIEALLKVAKRALKGRDHWVIAGLAFLGIFALNLPFPLLIALAALYGFLTGTGTNTPVTRPERPSTLPIILGWLALWWAPIAAIWLAAPNSILISIGLFFAKLAVVTFGGAYAVLAYMAQEVVEVQGWLQPHEMIDGLGLAETTPGPLILVTEFVGTIAGYSAGGIPLALAAAAITLWMTFVPCFLWIFAGAPYIAWLSAQPRLKNALAAVTAAVVGVILNLSIWFALHVTFDVVDQKPIGSLSLWVPDFTTLNPLVVALSLVAAVHLLVLKRNLLEGLALAAGLGVLGTAIL